MAKKIMTYLIINYPTPQEFEECLRATLAYEPEYLEIQLPFSNPIADGPAIRIADKKALEYDQSLADSLALIDSIKKDFPDCQTKLILMSYLNRIVSEGLTETASLLQKYNYYGLVCPDMLFGSPEQQAWKSLDTAYLIPLISPLTSSERLDTIKQQLIDGQLVYPTARIGITGQKTNLEVPETQDYFDFLEKNLADYQIAIGFGIREKSQIQSLHRRGFIPIVATAIIKEIERLSDQKLDLTSGVQEFLNQLTTD